MKYIIEEKERRSSKSRKKERTSEWWNKHIMQLEKTIEINKGNVPVLGFPGDDKKNGDDRKEEDHKEESGGTWHGPHAAHHDQVEDEDQQVQKSHHLHDKHARLLCCRACVHPREDGWA